jgi:hypothetical protein
MNPKYGKDSTVLGTLVSQPLLFADFTDSAGATGYIDFEKELPVGAIPLGWKATVVLAFDATSTAVIQVGVSGDTDRFTADATQSVATAGQVGSAAIAADAAKGLGAVATPRVTITEDSAFGDMTEGELIVEVYFLKP